MGSRIVLQGADLGGNLFGAPIYYWILIGLFINTGVRNLSFIGYMRQYGAHVPHYSYTNILMPPWLLR